MVNGDAEDLWLRPVWEEEEALEPSAPRLGRGAMPEAPPGLPLLRALSSADEALTRLDASAAAAPEAIRVGLVARLALREASGWLAWRSAWIHPRDLALLQSGATGSVSAAVLTGRVREVLPHTFRGAGLEAEDADIADDREVELALNLARLLRRLAESTSWRPLSSVEAARSALEPLGLRAGALTTADWDAWVGQAGRLRQDIPPLLAAAAAAGSWSTGRPVEEGASDLQAGFLAVAVLRETGRLRAVPMVLWSAVPARQGLRRLGGMPFAAAGREALAWLDLVTEAARTGLRELETLLAAAERGAPLVERVDRRSRLPAAFEEVLRAPALTAGTLAKRLDITRHAALRLLKELEDAGVVKEMTGRGSFRVYST